LHLFAVVRRSHAAVELDVAAQVELVGDVIEIAFGLGLGGKTLAPIPLVEQFLRKRIAVGMALGIKAGAWIPVPVPGAADPGGGLEDPDPQPELAQLIELVEPGNAGAPMTIASKSKRSEASTFLVAAAVVVMSGLL
jgi:hypothetical protein